MKHFLIAALFLALSGFCFGQRSEKYIGYEQRPYTLDSSGKAVYHPASLYPWVFEVVIEISGDFITMRKRPFYVNEKGIRVFADTARNTYIFKGRVYPAGPVRVARLRLMPGSAGYLYIDGKWYKEANDYFIADLQRSGTGNLTHTPFNFTDGKFYVLRKFTDPQVIISGRDETGIFINGDRYKSIR
jgi:hypothetical protein